MSPVMRATANAQDPSRVRGGLMRPSWVQHPAAEAFSHDTVAREVPIALDLGLMAEASVHTLSDHAAPK
jgi:hypothetical protein